MNNFGLRARGGHIKTKILKLFKNSHSENLIFWQNSHFQNIIFAQIQNLNSQEFSYCVGTRSAHYDSRLYPPFTTPRPPLQMAFPQVRRLQKGQISCQKIPNDFATQRKGQRPFRSSSVSGAFEKGHQPSLTIQKGQCAPKWSCWRRDKGATLEFLQTENQTSQHWIDPNR